MQVHAGCSPCCTTGLRDWEFGLPVDQPGIWLISQLGCTSGWNIYYAVQCDKSQTHIALAPPCLLGECCRISPAGGTEPNLRGGGGGEIKLTTGAWRL